ncbi:cysteine-tryptophan domain-containing zinc finger protein 7-like [Cornus florida]|uniref:cysteine-tryptophan domain-containing zinc finger protein 7-like n=1 Tax=Cornus florida TaxID=4283 RepID=UPI0028990965|nr:cysteine-tryptophan domain-containing zinc finger protein 7-like [Cornus florida]
MEETELEEGEVYKDNTLVDPDVAFSYIDEKLKSVLGHFQKDFEGLISAENLGPKFGGYGSFLPTYQRSQPKRPQRVQNHSLPRSPLSQNSTALSDAPLSQRLHTATHSLQSLHIARVASGDVSAIQVPCLSSGQVADKLCMKFEPSSNKSIYPTNQRTLKVRMKVGSDYKVPKNAAIYSGIGLISPSSSTGNRPEESGGIILESEEQSESPTSILQIMTSSHVPGSLLLSPLQGSVLCLIRKDKLPQNSKPVPALKSKADKDGIEDRLSYTDSGKEESLESISGQHGKNEKQEARGNWVEKTGDHRMRSSHRNVSIDDDRSKSIKIYSPFKAGSNVSRCKEDPNVWTMNHLKAKVVQKSTSHEQDEKMPSGRKSVFEGNRKSRGSQSNAKVASDLAEESLMVGVSAVSNDKKKAIKMHNLNLKSLKDIYKAHDKHRDVLEDTRREQMGNQMDRFQRRTGDSGKDSEVGAVDKELRASSEKLKGRSSYKKADNQLTSETFLKEDGNDCPPTSGALASELEPTLAPSVVIQENWVCCDQCQRWRLLPFGTKPEELPEKWLCSMLNWLPGMNRCDISEEETTRALNELYQLPLPGSHNGLQNHADKIVTGGNSAEVRHFDHKHKNPNSHAIPINRGKKKQVSKETPNMASDGGQMQLSNLKKNSQQEAVKSRSINDMNNSSVQHLSKSCNFAVEKNNIKQKEKQENGADVTRKKPKSKREAEQHAYGAKKKIKTEGAVDTNKYWNSKHDEYLVKADFSSGVELPNKVAGKSMQKHNGDYYSMDAKCDAKNILQISVKKPGESVQISRDTGSLDMKSYNGREMSLKKRKLDWHDSQKCLETLQSSGKHLPDIKFSAKEEPVDGEFRKEKKYREVRDLNASSPQRWDASGHTASNALKEAEDLREYADQLKISGFDFECNEAYFQAALKFLHCALLLETCNSDNYKHGEMSPMQIYNSSAKLCEICGHEYEKRQEMAAAALAYKCMEVAYMKVVYCKHSSTSRDRLEVLASLQVVPQGESPSSSASEVDNLNNEAIVNKAGLSKGIGSHAGNHFIIARNRPNFVRLLDFTKDVNSAMEASWKSQNAFAAANVILEDGQNKEGIVSVKRVIDFGFQDVEELIRLVKLAIGAISRQGFSGSRN